MRLKEVSSMILWMLVTWLRLFSIGKPNHDSCRFKTLSKRLRLSRVNESAYCSGSGEFPIFLFCSWNQDHKNIIHLTLFFWYPPSSGIAPCVGTAGMVQTPTLDVALRSSSRAGADLGWTSDSRVFSFYQLTSKACILKPRMDPAFCNWNWDKVFPLLDNWFTILRWDSIHCPPRHSFNWMWTSPSTNQATMVGLHLTLNVQPFFYPPKSD